MAVVVMLAWLRCSCRGDGTALTWRGIEVELWAWSYCGRDVAVGLVVLWALYYCGIGGMRSG